MELQPFTYFSKSVKHSGTWHVALRSQPEAGYTIRCSVRKHIDFDFPTLTLPEHRLFMRSLASADVVSVLIGHLQEHLASIRETIVA